MTVAEVCLLPRGPEALLLGLDPMGSPVLKARLPMHPAHPRAATTVLEGLALWGERRLSAVVGVGPRSTGLLQTLFPDSVGWCSPLFDLHVVEHPRPPRRRRRLDGVGDFSEVYQLRLPGVDR